MNAQTNLDALSRDPNDGAYHCPQCEAPFTRRSNLRRHYTIHTRCLAFKCHLCARRFARSDELDYHTQQCERRIWNGTTSDLFPALAGFDTNKNHEGGTGLASTMSTEAESNVPSPSSQLAGSFPSDLFSPVESRQCPEDDQDFSDFLSSFTSVSPPDMPPLPEMSFYDARQPRGHLQPNISRPGSSSSMSSILSSSTSPTLTAAKGLPGAISRLPSRRSSYSKSRGSSRRRTRERPVYTRRQVDDMLDAVSKCFVGTIEEVLKRAHADGRPSDSTFESFVPPVAMSNMRSDESRSLAFNDTFPQLLESLQGIQQENFVASRDS